MIDQLNNGQILVEITGPPQGCRSPLCRARAGPQLTPLAIPSTHSGTPSPAPGRSGQCARERQLHRGPGARDWQPPASALPPHPPSPGRSPAPACSAAAAASRSPPRGSPARGPDTAAHSSQAPRSNQVGDARSQRCPLPGPSMKVEFAPLNIPLVRRLQTAAVLQWVLSFLLLGKDPAGSRALKTQARRRGAGGLRLLPRGQSLSRDVLRSSSPSRVSQNEQVKEGVAVNLGLFWILSPRAPRSECLFGNCFPLCLFFF